MTVTPTPETGGPLVYEKEVGFVMELKGEWLSLGMDPEEAEKMTGEMLTLIMRPRAEALGIWDGPQETISATWVRP